MVEKKLNLKLNLTVLVLLLVISVRSQNQYSLDQAIKDARSHCAVSGMSVWMDKEHEILISNLNKNGCHRSIFLLRLVTSLKLPVLIYLFRDQHTPTFKRPI